MSIPRVAPLLALALSSPATAAVLIDQSPGQRGIPTSNYSNQSFGQNFLAAVSFANAVTLSGFDIYSSQSGFTVGAIGTFKLQGDSNGQPSGISLFELAARITAIDEIGAGGREAGGFLIQRVHVDLPSLLVAPGNYWIGLSGTSNQIGWQGFTGIANGGFWQLNINTPQFALANGETGTFRVLGDAAVAAVPEPASWGMMLLGFGVIGVALRYRRRRTTVRFVTA